MVGGRCPRVVRFLALESSTGDSSRIGYAVTMSSESATSTPEVPPTRISLRDLGLQSGQARREELELVVRPYRQGGFEYAVPSGTAAARVDITAMQSGLSFRLRVGPELHGPCSRCLEDASVTLEVDSYEVHDPGVGDEELLSDFVHDDDLDVTEWAQDAIGLEFPVRVLCSEHCEGLCPSCGVNRNTSNCECGPPPTDSRWDALKAIQLDTGTDADEEEVGGG